MWGGGGLHGIYSTWQLGKTSRMIPAASPAASQPFHRLGRMGRSAAHLYTAVLNRVALPPIPSQALTCGARCGASGWGSATPSCC